MMNKLSVAKINLLNTFQNGNEAFLAEHHIRVLDDNH